MLCDGEYRIGHIEHDARRVDLRMTLDQAHDLGRYLCEVARPPDLSYDDGLALVATTHAAGYCKRTDCPDPLPAS